jgi:cell division septation protein DedD
MVSSRESELFKDKIEVSLDGRQIFYLFFGGAVIATLVFVLGVMVGRRVEARSVAEVGGDVASDPLAALDKLERGSELAFPSTLRGGEMPLGQVDQVLAATGGPRTGKPVDAESEEVEPAIKAEKAKAEKAKAEKDKAEKDEVEKDKARPATAEPDPDPEPDPAESKPAKSNGGRFTLQVGSFQQREEAEALVSKIAAIDASLAAKIVQADLPSKGIYYRVRVGGYPSYDTALSAKADFEKDHHIIAYVTRVK